MEQGIQLIALKPKHAQQMANLANNYNIWFNLRDKFPIPYTLDDAEAFIDICEKEYPQQNFGISYNDELVGVVGLILQDDVYTGTAEIGFWLGEPYWGKGITTAAIKLIIGYGFGILKLRRIYGNVFDFNKASAKILQKCGFKLEGISKKAVKKNNVYYDELRFALLNQ